MLLTGCITDRTTLPPPLRVDLPEICEQILEPVDLAEFGPESDAVGAFLQRDSEVIVANERIKGGRACIRDQRQEYAGHGGN